MPTVNFIDNKDGRTLTMLVNDFIEREDVLYMPEYLLDLRGLELYIWCKVNDLPPIFEHFFFTGLEMEEIKKIEQHFDYMLNPIYVRKRIRREPA